MIYTELLENNWNVVKNKIKSLVTARLYEHLFSENRDMVTYAIDKIISRIMQDPARI